MIGYSIRQEGGIAASRWHCRWADQAARGREALRVFDFHGRGARRRAAAAARKPGRGGSRRAIRGVLRLRQGEVSIKATAASDRHAHPGAHLRPWRWPRRTAVQAPYLRSTRGHADHRRAQGLPRTGAGIRAAESSNTSARDAARRPRAPAHRFAPARGKSGRCAALGIPGCSLDQTRPMLPGCSASAAARGRIERYGAEVVERCRPLAVFRPSSR